MKRDLTHSGRAAATQLSDHAIERYKPPDRANGRNLMPSLSRMFSARVALALMVLAGVSLANPDNTWDGTWELNVARSKFDPGPPLKSQTRTIRTEGDMQTVTIKGANAEGGSVATKSTYRLDGKDYPIIGSTDVNALAMKRVDESTVSGALKRDGKVVSQVTRTLSKDGKVMTVTTKGTNPAGQPMNNVLVFDRR